LGLKTELPAEAKPAEDVIAPAEPVTPEPTFVAESVADIVATEQSAESASETKEEATEEAPVEDETTATEQIQNATEEAKENTEWKEQVNGAIDSAKDAIDKASEQAKPFFKELAANLKDTFNSVKNTVNDNVDWKELSLKVPTIASKQFETTLYFEKGTATILDIQDTNGDVKLEKGTGDGITIFVSGKFYGAKEDTDLIEEFKKRSEIVETSDKVVVKVPNVRVKADLIVYLPERMFDHVSVKTMNGDIIVDMLNVNDAAFSTTNGDIKVNDIAASMVETSATNGDMKVAGGTMKDLVMKGTNGDAIVTASPKLVSATLVNGDIRYTLKNADLEKVVATNTNGDVKVALPKEAATNGSVKTSFGHIKTRDNFEEVNDKTKVASFSREGEFPVNFDIRTVTGDIFLKDAE
jgi:DUF4097 and DUF4098 domain-containing protein YvlB